MLQIGSHLYDDRWEFNWNNLWRHGIPLHKSNLETVEASLPLAIPFPLNSAPDTATSANIAWH